MSNIYDDGSEQAPAAVSSDEARPSVSTLNPGARAWYRRNKIVSTCVATALVLAIGGGGFAFGAGLNSSGTTTSDASTNTTNTLPNQGFSQGNGTGSGNANGTGTGTGTNGSNGAIGGQGSQRASTQTAAVAATAAQKVGVVTIVSVLDYDENSQAAGTGTIMTSNGYILTNNHVIAGATSIKVTVESTNKTYTATVVGTDKTNDVAVLKIADVSGLTPASYATSNTVKVADAVTDVGNAEGTGDLVAATGTVTALAQSITVQGEQAGESEKLTNLIQISADVVSGDSGGPLVNASGKVIGMVTAASTASTNVTGFAIPIKTALSIAAQIRSGVATSTVVIGYPAFLGVQIAAGSDSSTTAGAAVAGAIAGTPAETLGLVAGDTITSVDGTPVASATALSTVISAHKVGDRVTVSWTDAAGATHTATAALVAGPAA
jgi:S1-C subfamily serine protease